MAQSGRKRCPRGEMSGCRQSFTVMYTPPTITAIALAMAAPSTPSPAPGMVKVSPSRVIGLVG